MRRVKKVLFAILISISFNTYATTGPIKQDSIIKCNDKFFGSHGSPIHWHEVIKKDNKWVSISQEVEIPSCYIRKVNEKEKVKFYKCSDGDTARFIINSEEKKVRFLAIDTPEVDKNEPFSKEAKDFTCTALQNAKEIYLEYDSNSDKEDKYGRLLAFVHVDGVLLQKSIIQQGLGKVAYIYGDYDYLEELRNEEKKAKEKKIGIWSQAGNEEKDLDTSEEAYADEFVLEDKEEVDEEENIIIEILRLIYEIVKKIIALIIK